MAKIVAFWAPLFEPLNDGRCCRGNGRTFWHYYVIDNMSHKELKRLSSRKTGEIREFNNFENRSIICPLPLKNDLGVGREKKSPGPILKVQQWYYVQILV